MYTGSTRLPAEKASKLSHLDVLNSDLVNALLKDFESSEISGVNIEIDFKEFEEMAPLSVIFAVDGSLQIIKSSLPPYKELAFVKTALLKLKLDDLKSLDQEDPHPLALKKIMTDSALYHATVFPLKFVNLEGFSVRDSVRKVIFESLKDKSLSAAPFETLKWLAYKKWDKEFKGNSPSFQCPYQNNEDSNDIHQMDISFKYDEEISNCKYCQKEIYLSDMMGFHLEMEEDSVQGSIASSYMLIHELLLLFTGVRLFWEEEKFNFLSKCLFLKDGPLALRSQYSKLVPNLREFFSYAKSKNITIHMAGQEKTGAFVDFFSEIIRMRKVKKLAPIKANSFFLLSNEYIKKDIQRRAEDKNLYGIKTNYGNKIFVKLNESHYVVLSIPVGDYTDSKNIQDLIGANRIFNTLKSVLSHSHENALVPIALANGVASLSTYPSAKILQMFSDSFE